MTRAIFKSAPTRRTIQPTRGLRLLLTINGAATVTGFAALQLVAYRRSDTPD